MILVFFSLCWTPVLLIDLADTILGRWTFPGEAHVAYTFLANISRALNPFIYGVLNRNFPTDDLGGNANVVELNPLRMPNAEMELYRKPRVAFLFAVLFFLSIFFSRINAVFTLNRTIVVVRCDGAKLRRADL